MPKYGMPAASTDLRSATWRRRLRVAGAVGEEHAVGMQRLDLGKRDRRRHYMNLEAALGHPCRSHGLDAEVNRHHTESRFTVRPSRRTDSVVLTSSAR